MWDEITYSPPNFKGATLYNGCNYLSMLGFKLIHISKRGPSKQFSWKETIRDIWHNMWYSWHETLNTLRPRQNGRHFPDDIFNWIFVNENAWISINISLKFVPSGPINNIAALVQIMAWRRPGDKPLSEPMLVFVPTHIWVTRPQWVKLVFPDMATYGFF